MLLQKWKDEGVKEGYEVMNKENEKIWQKIHLKTFFSPIHWSFQNSDKLIVAIQLNIVIEPFKLSLSNNTVEPHVSIVVVTLWTVVFGVIHSGINKKWEFQWSVRLMSTLYGGPTYCMYESQLYLCWLEYWR